MTATLVATQRTIGKGIARAGRRAGRVPGIIYGNKKANVAIFLEERDLVQGMRSGHFSSTVYTLDIEGRKEKVLPRELHLHPVTDRPTHLDFLRVGGGKQLVRMLVPVVFEGEAENAALKAGSVLNVVRHELELLCPSHTIPSELVCDISTYQSGDTIRVSALSLPKGATPTITERDFVLASIMEPRHTSPDESEVAEPVDEE